MTQYLTPRNFVSGRKYSTQQNSQYEAGFRRGFLEEVAQGWGLSVTAGSAGEGVRRSIAGPDSDGLVTG